MDSYTIDWTTHRFQIYQHIELSLGPTHINYLKCFQDLVAEVYSITDSSGY